MWEYMYSYCYFRYHQNMNFQQILPKAFAKSLKKRKWWQESAYTQFQAKLAPKRQNCLWLIIRNIENMKWAKKPNEHQEFFSCGRWHITLCSVTMDRRSMYWRSPTIKICAGHNLWLLNQHQLRYAMKTYFTTIFKTSQSAKSACSQ